MTGGRDDEHVKGGEGGLLGRLRQRRAAGVPAADPEALSSTRRPAAREDAARHARHTAFDNLPGMKELALQKAAGEKMGISNPYFRMQEGAAGPTCVIGGRTVLNFSSYNYQGFNGHPHVAAAAADALAACGTSAGASRVVAGERPFHAALEARLAALYGCPAALAFVSGFATNVTVIGALMGERDLVLADALIHNSVVQGARLSRATYRTFPHNDVAALDDMLRHARHKYERVLIVAEGLYSMDGDLCDLPGLVDVKRRHGCWLMIDEAHALGVTGAAGRGSVEHYSPGPGDVDIWMGTLSKTLASCGGYIAGPAALVEYLRFMCPGFVYSVGLSPVLAAAALAALELLETDGRRGAEALAAHGARFVSAARAAGLDTGLSAGYGIVPVMVRNSINACRASENLLAAGINALPIIPPAVEHSGARLRFFLSAQHTPAQIDEAVRVTAQVMRAL